MMRHERTRHQEIFYQRHLLIATINSAYLSSIENVRHASYSLNQCVMPCGIFFIYKR